MTWGGLGNLRGGAGIAEVRPQAGVRRAAAAAADAAGPWGAPGEDQAADDGGVVEAEELGEAGGDHGLGEAVAGDDRREGAGPGEVDGAGAGGAEAQLEPAIRSADGAEVGRSCGCRGAWGARGRHLRRPSAPVLLGEDGIAAGGQAAAHLGFVANSAMQIYGRSAMISGLGADW